MGKIISLLIISTLLILINSQTVYILNKAEESKSSDDNILKFNIEAGLSEPLNLEIPFEIESEFYDSNKFINSKKIICKIPESPDASFGTKIIIKCEIDLDKIDCLKSNKIKFIKFYENDLYKDIKIKDDRKNILENELIYEKRIKEEKEEKKELKDIKPDIIFTAESININKYTNNQLILLIKGKYDSFFTLAFEFDLILNNNIQSKCQSPNLIFEKEATINCTLILELRDHNFLEKIQNGISIKENIYKIRRSGIEEKTLKFSIKEGDKLEIKDFNFNKNDINAKITEETEEIEEQKSRWEIERELEKRRIEKEREDLKKKKDQEELEKLLKQRSENNQNQYHIPFFGVNDQDKNKYYPNNNQNNQNNQNSQNNNYNNKNSNENENEIIDYNSNVKLIHLQVRYSYGFIYYMFYALTPVPLGHKIKVGFTISKGSSYNYDLNRSKSNIVLKAEEEVNQEGKNIIIEYIARYECEQCQKFVLDKNSIYGAKVYNIPNEEYLLDAININRNGNYLQKNKMINPPLYITENIFNQNCMLELAGNFFNKNKFFISRFPLILIGVGYYNNNRNITIYCNLNERELFSCPINENINNFEFKIEQLIINQKDNNIIIDNSKMTRDGMIYRASCQMGNNNAILNLNNNYQNNQNNINQNNYNNLKNNEQKMPDVMIPKKTNWKKIFYIAISIVIIYYILTKCCCKKEEEENVEYDSRWRVSSANYGGESYGLRSRGW